MSRYMVFIQCNAGNVRNATNATGPIIDFRSLCGLRQLQASIGFVAFVALLALRIRSKPSLKYQMRSKFCFHMIWSHIPFGLRELRLRPIHISVYKVRACVRPPCQKNGTRFSVCNFSVIYAQKSCTHWQWDRGYEASASRGVLLHGMVP